MRRIMKELSIKDRQHWYQKALMKPFCYNKEKSYTNVLYSSIWDKIYSKPISRLCFENHYMKKSVDDHIRKKYENDFPRVIRKVIKNKTHTILTEKERQFFFEYWCISKFRLPIARNRIKNIFETSENSAKNTQENIILNQNILEYELKKFEKYNFCTIINETSVPLISPDPPIIENLQSLWPIMSNFLLNQKIKTLDYFEAIENIKGQIVEYMQRISSEDMLDRNLFLILSPKTVLKASKEKIPLKVTVTDEQSIEFKNFYSFLSCSKYVFSRSKKPLELVLDRLRKLNVNQKVWEEMKDQIEISSLNLPIPFTVKASDIFKMIDFTEIIPTSPLNIDNEGFKQLNKAKANKFINQLELIKKKFFIIEKSTLEEVDGIISILKKIFELEN